MAIPTREQLKKFAAGYVQLWNDGDKEGWRENWLAVGPGEFKMWDPCGTPPKIGFEHCAMDSWDLFQKRVSFHTPKETLFFNPGHIAWVMQKTLKTSGAETLSASGNIFVGQNHK